MHRLNISREEYASGGNCSHQHHHLYHVSRHTSSGGTWRIISAVEVFDQYNALESLSQMSSNSHPIVSCSAITDLSGLTQQYQFRTERPDSKSPLAIEASSSSEIRSIIASHLDTIDTSVISVPNKNGPQRGLSLKLPLQLVSIPHHLPNQLLENYGKRGLYLPV